MRSGGAPHQNKSGASFVFSRFAAGVPWLRDVRSYRSFQLLAGGFQESWFACGAAVNSPRANGQGIEPCALSLELVRPFGPGIGWLTGVRTGGAFEKSGVRNEE